jgi:hypothetical protein
LNLRPLGYEQYDVRLWCLARSPVVALTCSSTSWPSSASRAVSAVAPHPGASRAQIRAQIRSLTCGFAPVQCTAHIPRDGERPIPTDLRQRPWPLGNHKVVPAQRCLRAVQPPPDHCLDLGSCRKVIGSKASPVQSSNVLVVDRRSDALMSYDLHSQAPGLVTANLDPYPLPQPQAFGAIGHLIHEGSLAAGPFPAQSPSRRVISPASL